MSEMIRMRPLPKKVNKWAQAQIPAPRNLYYKKRGDLVTVTCAACGEKHTAFHRVPKNTDPFEAKLVKTIEVNHNAPGKCQKCGSRGIYKAEGRCKNVYIQTAAFIYGQRHGEDFVFRAYIAKRKSRINMPDEDSLEEYARIILKKGKKPEKWFYAYSYLDKTSTWVEGWPNMYGGRQVYTDKYHPDTFKEIKDTPMLKYGNHQWYDPIQYYSAFSRYPDMELVQKAGMKKLMQALLWQQGANINPRGKTIEDRLRIYKSRLPELRAHEGDITLLHIFQKERKEKARYTREDIDKELYISQMYQADKEVYAEVLKHTTVKRLEEYLKKANAQQYIYRDYISMRMRAGDDLDNEVYLFPKDLRRRHNEQVRMFEKKKNDIYKAEMEKNWPEIAKRFTKLEKKYGYESGRYIIHPAHSASDIVEEGRILHHCVGSSNTYFRKHAKGESFILFLRLKKEPDIPYATVEIRGNKVVQWYEAHDQKPHEKSIQPWLDAYCEKLSKKKGA